MRYVFKESMIWDAYNAVDHLRGKQVKVKAKSETRARQNLPEPGTGRVWILIESFDN